MNKYKHIFFDLDHTLWDFEKNSRETITDLFHHYALHEKGVASAVIFFEKYSRINADMWDLYHKNQIDRETLRTIRFKKTFEHFGISDSQLASVFPSHYLELLPDKKNLLDDAIDVLDYLQPKYTLHLITNGFEKVQHAKLDSSGLKKYFKEFIISEKTGFKKPDKEIFQFALQSSGAEQAECLMIGDDAEADIKGALNAGWDAVFFNPSLVKHELSPNYEITRLKQLMDFL